MKTWSLGTPTLLSTNNLSSSHSPLPPSKTPPLLLPPPLPSSDNLSSSNFASHSLPPLPLRPQTPALSQEATPLPFLPVASLWHILQEVYGKLEEPDGLAGLLRLRQGPPRLQDQLLAAEKAGSWSEALALHEQVSCCCRKLLVMLTQTAVHPA